MGNNTTFTSAPTSCGNYALVVRAGNSVGYSNGGTPFRFIVTDSKGDPDGDGEITVSDALIALRVAAKLAEATPELIACCDTDGDGVIAVNDALAILRVAAKLADSL